MLGALFNTNIQERRKLHGLRVGNYSKTRAPPPAAAVAPSPAQATGAPPARAARRSRMPSPLH